MADAVVDLQYSEAFEAVKLKFGIPSLREYQLKFFGIFAENPIQDFFIAQPTGNGKSLLFQGLPFFLSKLPPLEDGSSRLATISLVIAPLTALVEDQISILKKKDIVAKRMSEDLVSLGGLTIIHTF